MPALGSATSAKLDIAEPSATIFVLVARHQEAGRRSRSPSKP
jgi:hypothetical protein